MIRRTIHASRLSLEEEFFPHKLRSVLVRQWNDDHIDSVLQLENRGVSSDCVSIPLRLYDVNLDRL